MKALLRRTVLISAIILTAALSSCDTDDWKLEKEIIGSWGWYYEEPGMYEEIIYNFTSGGKWSYMYIYEDEYGRYQSDVDGGYYNIDFGYLKLHSNFSGDNYSYDIDISGKRMRLRKGDFRLELERLR